MKLLLDSNVLTPMHLNELEPLAANKGIKLVVPALIHAEYVFQLKRRMAGRFDLNVVRTYFEVHQAIRVEALDQDRAEELAMALAQRFPDDAAWRRIKREAYFRAVGQEPPAAVSNRRAGAPVDLYVAALGTVDAPIVTADKGPEWRGMPDGTVISYNDALRWIAAA